MDLSLNETQQLIKDSAKDYVHNACSRDTLLKIDRNPGEIMGKHWKEMSEMGWAGIAIPEAYGGSGNDLTDVGVLFEELGTGPVPGPLFSSAVLCARILLETGTEAQKKALLPGIASGERVFALAFTEAQFGWTAEHVKMKAKKEGADHVLSGTKLFVDDAEYATDLLVVARVEGAGSGGGVSVFRVDAKAKGVSIRTLPGFMTGKSEVIFDKVGVGAADVIGSAGDAWAGLDKGMITALPILCAYKVGGCRQVFDMSLAYAGERKQFGQVIGRFARVQDHIIHLVNYLDSARWTTYEALWRLDTNQQDAASSCHVAKAASSEGYMRATDYAHEVHAGIGVVREYGLTLHTKMSRSLYHTLGAPKLHYKRLEHTLMLVA
jgi:alkylation response protein AidB-like acyl-CoA dehydrogenase